MERIQYRIFVLLSLPLLLLTACGKSTEQQYQEQYDLGMSYLEEQNYEQAVVAFSAAIEIDPNHADAYIGRGDVYAAWAGILSEEDSIENYENALQDYETAQAMGSFDPDLIAQKKETIQTAVDEIEKGNMEQWSAPLTPEEDLVFQAAVSALSSQESRSINDALFHSEFRTIVEKYGFDMEDGRIRFDYGDTVNGTGISLEMDQYKNGLWLYYGTWKNGVADGQGIMAAILTGAGGSLYSEQFEKAVGSWRNGYAEGAFEFERNYFGGTQEGQRTVITGSLAGGLWDGEAIETTTSGQESTTIRTIFEDGKGVQTGEIENLLDGSMLPQYGINENGESVRGVGGYDSSREKAGLMWSQIYYSADMNVLNASLSYYLHQGEENAGHLLFIIR